MVQLHCPRCNYSTPAPAAEPAPRLCPHCSTEKLAVPLSAVATLPRPGGVTSR